MNILYICDEYPPGRHGGIGTAVQLLAREMVKQGHKVIVAGFYDWAYGGEDQFEDNGVLVYRFRRLLKLPSLFTYLDSLPTRVFYRLLHISGVFEWDIKRSLKRYQAFLNELIAMYEVDIVEIPDYHDYMRFCKKPVSFPQVDVPTVVKLHGSIAYFLSEAGKTVPETIIHMERDLFNNADAWAGVSNYTLEKTKQYLELGVKNSTILFNGIHIEPPSGIVKVQGRVVFTGTLVEKKGIYQLMKAWNLVHQRLPMAQLWVFGKGDTRKLQSLLTGEAANTVFFKGHVQRETLLQQLAEANLCVFPSYAETFGLAAVEAMACGTAVIFTTRTSGPEIIDHKVNGLLVDPDDVKALSNEIIFLLENSEVCNNLARMGQKKAAEQFNIELIAHKHVKYYLDIINGTVIS